MGVLVPSLELDDDDVHTDELLSPFIRVFPQVLIVCHTVAEGTCKLVDNDIDPCPIRYFGVGIQSINFIKIILDRASLPEFVNLQVCSICAVMVSIVQFDSSLYFSPGCVVILVSLPPDKSFSFHT